jgi:hypothetical protein
MQTESANHVESTGHAQEKSARSYGLEFTPNLELALVGLILVLIDLPVTLKKEFMFLIFVSKSILLCL